MTMSDHDFTSRTIDNLEILFVTAIAVARHRANRDASLSFNLMGILNEITAVDDAVYFANRSLYALVHLECAV